MTTSLEKVSSCTEFAGVVLATMTLVNGFLFFSRDYSIEFSLVKDVECFFLFGMPVIKIETLSIALTAMESEEIEAAITVATILAVMSTKKTRRKKQ